MEGGHVPKRTFYVLFNKKYAILHHFGPLLLPYLCTRSWKSLGRYTARHDQQSQTVLTSNVLVIPLLLKMKVVRNISLGSHLACLQSVATFG